MYVCTIRMMMVVEVVVVVDISEDVNNWERKRRVSLVREIGHGFFQGCTSGVSKR